VTAALGTFGTQLGIAVVSFAGALITAHVLGPAGRGELTFLVTVSMLSATIGLLGVDDANVNFAGREPATRRALASNSVVLSLLLGCLVIAILTVLIALVPSIGGESAPWLRWLAIAAVPMLILKIYLKFILQADFHFRMANTAWLLPPLANLVVNVAMALMGVLTVASAFVSWTVTHAVATALLVAFVARRSTGFGRPSAALARRTLRFGVRSHPGRVMMAGNYRLDQWFVGAIAGSRELGLYSIAVSLSEILFYLPTALTISQRPYLVRAGKREAGQRAARVFRASLILTAASAAGLAAAAPLLVPALFGAEFGGSVGAVQILAAGSVGVLALKLLGNALTAQGRPGLATAGAAVGFVAMVALDALLIPAHGGDGAALASTASYTLGGVVIVAMFMRFFHAPARWLVPRPSELPLAVRGLLRPGRVAPPADANLLESPPRH
jgi:O-antigen/teichoic acid export membrane protein